MVETASDRTSPRIQQLSFFLENRLGALRDICRRLENESIEIRALSIHESADHAVIRIVVDKPSAAQLSLEREGHPVFANELLGVALPNDAASSMQQVLQRLLMGEVDIKYVYSLIGPVDDRPVMLLKVENADWASHVLVEDGFVLVNQDEIA